VLLLCSFASFAFGQESHVRSFRTSSRNFLVQGTNPVQLVSVGKWAERVADRVEKAVGAEPLGPGEAALRIRVHEDAGTNAGSVLVSQSVMQGKLVQQMHIRNYAQVDWEDALESLGILLLNRHATVCRTRRGLVHEEVAMPDWLAVGLVQNLDPALRSRNRRLVLGWDDMGEVSGIAGVFELTELPRGRCREKAVAGVAVGLILSKSDSEAGFRAMFERAAARKALSEEWMAAEIFGCRSAEEMENDWRNRLEGERRVIEGMSGLSTAHLAALRAQLEVRRGAHGAPDDPRLPAVMKPADLIELKNEPWIARYCKAKRRELGMAKAGITPEFAALADDYSSFFVALGRARQDSLLRLRLRRANKRLARLEKTVAAREAYMDVMEELYGGPGDGGEQGVSPDSGPRHERTRMQKYLDEIERRNRASDE
jgi:hypothetical protein